VHYVQLSSVLVVAARHVVGSTPAETAEPPQKIRKLGDGVTGKM